MSYTKCRPFYLGWNVLILNWCRLKTSSFGSWLSGCHQASHFNFDYVMPVVVKRHRTTIERNNSIACRPKTWAINSSKWSEAAKQIRLCLAELIVRQWQFGGWSASEMKSYWKLRQADVPGDASICARSPSFGGQLQLISAASVLWAIMGRMRARPEVRPTMKSRPLPDGTARERGACWAGSGAVGLREKNDKMAGILQLMFSRTFSWQEIAVFWLKFHQKLFIAWSNADQVHWYIYASQRPQFVNI